MIRVEGMGDRLRIERERLRLSLGDFASLGKIARTTEFRYEAGAYTPSLEFLEAIEPTGVDILYILSGFTLEARTDALADAMQFVEDLLAKHGVELTARVRARLISRVLQARLAHPAEGEATPALASLLEVLACPTTK